MSLQEAKSWLVENVGVVRFLFAWLRNRELWRTMQAERWVRDALERSDRHGLADFAFRGGRAYVVTPRGCELVYVPGRPYTTLGMELKGGSFEEPELDTLIRLAPGASLILDIGANCGYLSIALAASNPKVRIRAFEPVPSTFDSLLHNCRHNRVDDRVHCEQMAVGAQPGTMQMTSGLNTGNYLLPQGRGDNASSIAVPVTTVDEYLASHGLQGVDGIKCDTEGAELFMIRGAAACLERDRPWLLLEIAEALTTRQGYRPEELVAELARHGYSYLVVDEASGRLQKAEALRSDLQRTVNFLFLHRESPWWERLELEPRTSVAAQAD
jgi:FkbM family methyltransferase